MLSEHLFLLRITGIWLASRHGVVEFSFSLRYRNWKKSDASCNEMYQTSPPNDWKLTKTCFFCTWKQRYIFTRDATQHLFPTSWAGFKKSIIRLQIYSSLSRLFVDLDKVSTRVKDHLNVDLCPNKKVLCVLLKSYDSITAEIKTLAKEKQAKIWVSWTSSLFLN